MIPKACCWRALIGESNLCCRKLAQARVRKVGGIREELEA